MLTKERNIWESNTYPILSKYIRNKRGAYGRVRRLLNAARVGGRPQVQDLDKENIYNACKRLVIAGILKMVSVVQLC